MADIEPKKKNMLKGIIFFLLRVGIAAGIIGYLLSRYQGNFLESISHFNPLWIALAFCCYIFQICFGAFRWQLLLKVQRIHLSFFEALSLTMQGIFFSMVIPGGAVGGDLAKVGFLSSRTPPGQKIEGAFTIFMDRFTGMIGLFGIAFAVPFFAGDVFRKVDGVMELAIYALFLGAIGGLGAGIVFCFHKHFEKISLFRWFLDFADKYMHGALRRIFTTLDYYKSAWKTVLFCIVGSIFFVHLTIALAVFCIAQGGNVPEASVQNVAASVTIANTAGAIPGPPSGLGTRDLVMTSMFKAAGYPQNKAIEIPLMNTALILAYSLLGGLFFVFESLRKKKYVHEHPAQKEVSSA